MINFYTYEDEGEKKIIMGKIPILLNPHEKANWPAEVVHIYNDPEDKYWVSDAISRWLSSISGINFWGLWMLGKQYTTKISF